MTAPLTRVTRETVTGEHAGRRIDNYLSSRLGGAPRSLIYKLLRSGQVRVNGGRVKPDYRLAADDEIRIPPVEIGSPDPAHIPAARLRLLAAAVVFEDEQFLVVDKPAGLACHGGSGVPFGVIEMARSLRPDIGRLDLAHRLDRDTSGCLVLTKHVAALRAFHEALRNGEVSKRYRALVSGTLPDDLTHIDAALEAVRTGHGERRSTVNAAGKAARTRIAGRERHGCASLLDLQLLTGRMHQIRAHAQHIGHPIGGDPIYGAEDFNLELRKLGLNRMFLHAIRLEFQVLGADYDIFAPLPAELDSVLDKLDATP